MCLILMALKRTRRKFRDSNRTWCLLFDNTYLYIVCAYENLFRIGASMEVELLSEGFFFETTKFKKYRVCSTGLSVTILEHEGPIVSADIALKTLTSDNDGLPHTLEHLIFMGSSSYPKGFLDFAANRCLSNGTNAWTDQDHTAYTVSCAGKEGFLSFLPIFLDHILFPILTDEGFVTEVYHINGDGQDGGVVYCEMQTYENTMDCIADRAFLKSVFGNGSPYAVETGGMLHELRTSCKIDKCRKFHELAYKPENMNIIICGNISIEEVSAAITTVNNKILKDESGNRMKQIGRPKMGGIVAAKAQSFSSISLDTVSFPSPEDDDPGCMLFGFKSLSLDQPKEILAEDIIIEYLINTSASPLTKDLVHIPEPFCSSISYHRYYYPTTVVQIRLQETNSEKHTELKDVVYGILSKVQEGSIDLDRINSLLKNKYHESKLEIENNDLDNLVSLAIVDHLYEEDCPSMLEKYAKMDKYYEELLGGSQDFWEGVLKRFMDSLVACVASQPSQELLTTMEEEEDERIEKRIEELGEEKLSDHGETLAKAEEFNDNTISPELFSGIKKPDISQFEAYDVSTTLNQAALQPNVFLHNIKSSFYRFYFIIDTDQFSDQEKSLVPLFLEACCNLPIVDASGISMSGDEVASKCEKLFLSHSVSLGLFKEQICLEFTLSEDNLEQGMVLLQQILFRQVVDNKRIKEYLQNLKSTVKANKRCGYESLQSLVYQHLYPYSVTAKSSLFCQEHFLESVGLEDACTTLGIMLKELFKSDCCLHIMSNSELLQQLDICRVVSLFNLGDGASEKSNFVKLKAFLCKDLDRLMEEDMVVKVPGEETSYMASIIPTFQSLYDPLDIKMRVFKNWFGNLDGVIGREVRGKGLAYHYYAQASSLDGNLMMQLQQSTDVSAAFCAVKELIDRIVSSENPTEIVDENQVELAKSATFYSLVEKVRSSYNAALWDLNFIHDKTERKPFEEIARVLDQVKCQDIVDLCKEFYYKLFTKSESVKIYTIPQNKDV